MNFVQEGNGREFLFIIALLFLVRPPSQKAYYYAVDFNENEMGKVG